MSFTLKHNKMKKIFQFFLLFIVINIVSCKKEHTDQIKNVALNITIQTGTTYTLDLSQYGDDDDLAEIVTQANSFTKSEISQTKMPSIYTFLKDGNPKAGGNSNEVVVLKVSEPTRRNCSHETKITINFTVQ